MSLNYMDKYNAIVGSIIAFLTFLFGAHWILFALFLLFNVVDWITGWVKSYIAGKENSMKGLTGVIKKFCYWLMILVSFSMSVFFIEIGEVLGINLGITTLIGWFVLGSLTINELRSIVENWYEAGFYVPVALSKGLEVANKVINQEEKE